MEETSEEQEEQVGAPAEGDGGEDNEELPLAEVARRQVQEEQEEDESQEDDEIPDEELEELNRAHTAEMERRESESEVSSKFRTGTDM